MADAKADLRAAWDEMMAELARARDAIDDPSLHPAPPTERNLAEGYRYLLGQVSGAIGVTPSHAPKASASSKPASRSIPSHSFAE